MTPRVALETLGCKLNQYETDAIAAGFQTLGWVVVDAQSPAEAYVVNTCTVTDNADRKSAHTLTRSVGRAEGAIVVATGCFAESARDRLERQPGVTFVVANARKNQIPALVDAHWKGEVLGAGLPLPDRFGFPVHDKVFHTRASLKIQDGCDNFCTFCIIPAVRGRAVSRPFTEVLETARQLIAGGRKELVLTGVNMGRWTDGGLTFTDLVEAVLHLEGDFRVRITSLEPDGLGERFASLLNHPKLCPHLHLCLQSGSPRVLLAMRREYSLDSYQELAALFRSRRPDLNLTTDLIVGFPGETPDEFAQSLDAIERVGFGYVHVFPYSRRQDTRAERMPDQVPEDEKTRRSRQVQRLMQKNRGESMRGLLGQRRRVLIETSRNPENGARGLTEDYFPVRLPEAEWNTFVEVELKELREENGEWLFEARPV